MGEHKYILCKEEEAEAMLLTEFLKAESIQVTERFTPPGSCEEILFASEDGRLVLRRISSTLYGMHKYCGRTVKSKLKMDYLWVTSDGDVKLKGLELCTTSRSRVNMTYRWLGKLLRKHIFHKELPMEIEQWIELIESKSADAYDMQYLIKCHPSIMADRNKLELFMRVFRHLWPIKARRRKAYDGITDGLPYEGNWKTIVQGNHFLREIYYYEDKYGNRTVYEEKIEGLMHFLKNCDSHLHEKALPENAREPLFQTWHLASMTFGTIPLFLGALAQRMHQKCELQGLEVQDLMA